MKQGGKPATHPHSMMFDRYTVIMMFAALMGSILALGLLVDIGHESKILPWIVMHVFVIGSFGVAHWRHGRMVRAAT